MREELRIEFANTLRGFAALSVVVSHYFGVFWTSRAVVETITNAPALPLQTHAVPSYVSWLHSFALFNWGAYGVALFFLISGFVIPFSLQKTSWLGFAVSRGFRIMPTYFAGFSVTLLAVLASSEYFGRPWPYSIQEVLVHYVPGLRDIAWSRSIDGIIWTLEIEMRFYIACAILITWFRVQSLKVFLAPIVLFLIAIYLNRMLATWGATNASAWRLTMTYMMISQYLIFMFIGVMFHYLYRGQIDTDKAYLGIGVLFVMFCIHWWAGPYSGSLNVAWSYTFALLTFAFAYSFPQLFKSNRTFDFLAAISYPLYVVHGVAGYVALRLMLDRGFKAWLSLLVVTATLVALSWLLHLLIEKPSQALGRQFASALAQRSARARQSVRANA